jgi:8-oxo-dGTP pyrophosphatase MutT (NUDIX family)
MIDVERLARALAAHQPDLRRAPGKALAAVAMVLRPGACGAELLFIERTRHPQDPWSGDIAFPGGRLDPDDRDLLATAVREAREEVGLRLESEPVLGRLSDLTGKALPVQVAAFVFAVEAAAVATPNEEVAQAFWTPVASLLEPQRQLCRTFPFPGLEGRAHPAIELLGPGRPVLWGLTYRFAGQLLQLAGCPLPAAARGW